MNSRIVIGLFIAILALFASCYSPNRILDKAGVKNEDCRKLLLTLQRKIYSLRDSDDFYGFKFDSEKLSEKAAEYTGLADEVYFGLSSQKSCINGLKKKDVIKLFGGLPKYNNPIHRAYIYLIKLGKNCPNSEVTPDCDRYCQCDLLRFIFDEKGHLIEVNFMASTIGWYNGYD